MGGKKRRRRRRREEQATTIYVWRLMFLAIAIASDDATFRSQELIVKKREREAVKMPICADDKN